MVEVDLAKAADNLRCLRGDVLKNGFFAQCRIGILHDVSKDGLRQVVLDKPFLAFTWFRCLDLIQLVPGLL